MLCILYVQYHRNASLLGSCCPVPFNAPQCQALTDTTLALYILPGCMHSCLALCVRNSGEASVRLCAIPAAVPQGRHFDRFNVHNNVQQSFTVLRTAGDLIILEKLQAELSHPSHLSAHSAHLVRLSTEISHPLLLSGLSGVHAPQLLEASAVAFASCKRFRSTQISLSKSFLSLSLALCCPHPDQATTSACLSSEL